VELLDVVRIRGSSVRYVHLDELTGDLEALAGAALLERERSAKNQGRRRPLQAKKTGGNRGRGANIK
jgi:hypothetical protein